MSDSSDTKLIGLIFNLVGRQKDDSQNSHLNQ